MKNKIIKNAFLCLFAGILLVGACSKDKKKGDNLTFNQTYFFEMTIDGKLYKWTGGAPGVTETGQCTYYDTGVEAAISMALGPASSIRPLIVGVLFPSGTGKFTLNPSSGEQGFACIIDGVTGYSSLDRGGNVVLEINAISKEYYGPVSGSVNGTLGEELPDGTYKIHTISGTFTASNLTY